MGGEDRALSLADGMEVAPQAELKTQQWRGRSSSPDREDEEFAFCRSDKHRHQKQLVRKKRLFSLQSPPLREDKKEAEVEAIAGAAH